ncbi:phosphatidylserine decarboxylase-domain-containing protein [Aspergillus transmontanensis]|uniref:Phosphatidylserine decarboxylase-domain-containing protein n=1 Tax=Aspergillus transmontanensis TaxID=1034304 RepID=A0A5N6VWJ0_9EURO|nr:phosphatidylserine decarboxylase-domain-containing protein [Aspergillus transmontanensis]
MPLSEDPQDSWEPLVCQLWNYFSWRDFQDVFNAACHETQDMEEENMKQGEPRTFFQVDTESPSDELLQKLTVFYWVFRQSPIDKEPYQKPITPENSGANLTWLSYWLSLGGIYSFYLNPKYSKDGPTDIWPCWDEPKDGWKSFNHWFSREFKSDAFNRIRPVGDWDIVSPADSTWQGSWDVRGGEVEVKKVNWPIKKLLRIADTDTTYDNGTFMHAFLKPNNYHRKHIPVTGRVVRAENIQERVYLKVAKENGKLKAKRELALDPEDEANYQWCQTRAIIEIDTDHGNSMTYFQFGGSDIVIVFQNKVKFADALKPPDDPHFQAVPLLVRGNIGNFS